MMVTAMRAVLLFGLSKDGSPTEPKRAAPIPEEKRTLILSRLFDYCKGYVRAPQVVHREGAASRVPKPTGLLNVFKGNAAAIAGPLGAFVTYRSLVQA